MLFSQIYWSYRNVLQYQLDEAQDTELKETVIILIKEFKGFKDHTNQRLNKLKQNVFKENALLISKKTQM